MTPAITVQEGDELPPFVRTTGFPEWIRFAAVNDEFVAIHMDDAAGQAAGLPGAIGMGFLQVAYLHNMLRDWLAGRGTVKNLSAPSRSARRPTPSSGTPEASSTKPPGGRGARLAVL